MFEQELEKAEEPEIKLPTLDHEKREREKARKSERVPE